jgi:hypothetical protein
MWVTRKSTPSGMLFHFSYNLGLFCYVSVSCRVCRVVSCVVCVRCVLCAVRWRHVHLSEQYETGEGGTLDMAKPRPIDPIPVESAHFREGSRKNLLRAIQGAP